MILCGPKSLVLELAIANDILCNMQVEIIVGVRELLVHLIEVLSHALKEGKMTVCNKLVD
jgi:hypothetical protein